MPYTNNTPQATQTVASSQPQVQDNFEFIQTDMQVEHIFNANAPFGAQAEGTHVQCSMPNQSPEVSFLPSGTGGVYYVASSKPKFYDGTSHYFLSQASISQFLLTGTATLNGTPSTVVTLPANSVGTYYLIQTTGAPVACAMGQFVTGSGAIAIGAVSDPNISVQGSGLNFQAETTSGTYNGTYKYVIQYYTP